MFMLNIFKDEFLHLSLYRLHRSIELPKSTEIPERTEIPESIELPKSTNLEEFVTQHRSESDVKGSRLIYIANFTTKEHQIILYHIINTALGSVNEGGGRVVQWCWVKFQYRGVLLIWISVGQGPT